MWEEGLGAEALPLHALAKKQHTTINKRTKQTTTKNGVGVHYGRGKAEREREFKRERGREEERERKRAKVSAPKLLRTCAAFCFVPYG